MAQSRRGGVLVRGVSHAVFSGSAVLRFGGGIYAAGAVRSEGTGSGGTVAGAAVYERRAAAVSEALPREGAGDDRGFDRRNGAAALPVGVVRSHLWGIAAVRDASRAASRRPAPSAVAAECRGGAAVGEADGV